MNASTMTNAIRSLAHEAARDRFIPLQFRGITEYTDADGNRRVLLRTAHLWASVPISELDQEILDRTDHAITAMSDHDAERYRDPIADGTPAIVPTAPGLRSIRSMTRKSASTETKWEIIRIRPGETCALVSMLNVLRILGVDSPEAAAECSAITAPGVYSIARRGMVAGVYTTRNYNGPVVLDLSL